MSKIADVNPLAFLHESDDVLGTEAVADGTDILKSLLFQVGDGFLDDGINLLDCVWVVSIVTFLQPLEDVESLRRVQPHWVSVEEINEQGVVAVCSELISHELGVLPDSNHIW